MKSIKNSEISVATAGLRPICRFRTAENMPSRLKSRQRHFASRNQATRLGTGNCHIGKTTNTGAISI
jgi:hypothetical protein